MVPTYIVMDYSSSICTDSTWYSGRNPPSRVGRRHYSLGGARLGHTSVGRVFSVRRSGQGCHGSSGNRSRFVLTGILEPQGAIPQALTLLGEARLITWRLRCLFLGECRRGLRHFGECGACLGYGPVLEPT